MTATSFDNDQRPRPFRTAVGRSLGKWLGIGVVLAAFISFGGPMIGNFFNHGAPFAERTVDRTQPAILQALTDLHDYRASSATFDIVVDVEKDAKWMPAALRGEHRVMTARGSVDAGVDLSSLNASAVLVDDTTKAIRITLPHARLRRPAIDLSATHMVVHKRGLLDRIGSALGSAPSGEKPMIAIAERKLVAAAKASDVKVRAEKNTREMITALVKGLGHTNVTVEFVDTPAVVRTAPAVRSL